MLHNFEHEAAASRDRHQQLLHESSEQRLVRLAQPAGTPLAHRAARYAGRMLVRAGARLLRFGRSEHAVLMTESSARGAALN